ncbi:MAG TPA: aldo/keto reductase [Bacilli bacterium]|nr:aldo/keto reductase [Bacilli bacterium]
MEYFNLRDTSLKVSRIGLGLMRLKDKTPEEAKRIIKTALDVGINFFDHADIYGDGVSEQKFSAAIKALETRREDLIIQSKVGIRRDIGYDFSYAHIIESVDGILKRLDTSYLDILLLHRPDMLYEPPEIARAFKELHASGKVRYFGVSNMHQFQLSYLQKEVGFPLLVNQLQFSLGHLPLVSSGIFANHGSPQSNHHALGLLDYMREHKILMQAWSPFLFGNFAGVYIDHPEFKELNTLLDEFSTKYGVTKEAISIAFILRHPAGIQPIIGTMNTERIKAVAKAVNITLSREDWYALFKAAGNHVP